MGVCLVPVRSTTDRPLIISWAQWRGLTLVAEAYGWQPAGTTGPGDLDDWEARKAAAGPQPDGAVTIALPPDRGYFSNEGQQVAAADALELAAALQRGIDYPPHPAIPDDAPVAMLCSGGLVRDVIAFARNSGGFCIH